MRSIPGVPKFATLLCALAFAAFAGACGDDPEPTATEQQDPSYARGGAEKIYHVDLGTLNNSGVSGTATLTLDGTELTVTIHATGLEADSLHLKHIHGAAEHKGNATCPPPSADGDGDGLVSFAEGLPFYGPVMLDLLPFTTTDGSLDIVQTFAVDAQALGPLQNRTIVLHGLTVNGVYNLSLPVACGVILPTPRGL